MTKVKLTYFDFHGGRGEPARHSHSHRQSIPARLSTWSSKFPRTLACLPARAGPTGPSSRGTLLISTALFREVSLSGRRWGRPDDTFGIAGAINGISSIHEAFLNDGGLGILVGDSKLPHPGLEDIFETYYRYAASQSTHLSLDYQFIANPAYNTDRGPVNAFAGRAAPRHLSRR